MILLPLDIINNDDEKYFSLILDISKKRPHRPSYFSQPMKPEGGVKTLDHKSPFLSYYLQDLTNLSWSLENIKISMLKWSTQF